MEKKEEDNTEKTSINQEQIHNLLFSKELGWQEIIYDLINTEQLNPWNINISILSNKYLEKINQLEEADFYISSKVLLAASLLLRIKSEILLNKYITSIDEILFGKKDSTENKYSFERIELDEEIPELIPKTPVPRYKKVTLKELIESLNKAIKTENRRIKKEIINRNALKETGISLPKKKFSIKDKMKEIHQKIVVYFEGNKKDKKVGFYEIIGNERKDKISGFFPLLHLENQKKVWLEQKEHFDEIDIWIHKIYFKHNPDPHANIKEELEKQMQEKLKKQKN